MYSLVSFFFYLESFHAHDLCWFTKLNWAFWETPWLRSNYNNLLFQTAHCYGEKNNKLSSPLIEWKGRIRVCLVGWASKHICFFRVTSVLFVNEYRVLKSIAFHCFIVECILWLLLLSSSFMSVCQYHCSTLPMQEVHGDYRYKVTTTLYQRDIPASLQDRTIPRQRLCLLSTTSRWTATRHTMSIA